MYVIKLKFYSILISLILWLKSKYVKERARGKAMLMEVQMARNHVVWWYLCKDNIAPILVITMLEKNKASW